MFKFKGISSTDMGVVLNDEIFEVTPAVNYEETTIDGRDGSIYTALNYKNVVVTKTATLLNKGKFDRIKTWLSGEGVFEYNGRCRLARIYDSLDPEKHGPFKYSFEITFIMDPFWYIDTPFQNVNDGVIYNSGNTLAKPILLLKGSGTVDLKVGNVRFAVTFDEDCEIEIDCEKKEESKPKCIEIEFEYPSLQPGCNDVTIYAGTCELYVKRKDRWI